MRNGASRDEWRGLRVRGRDTRSLLHRHSDQTRVAGEITAQKHAIRQPCIIIAFQAGDQPGRQLQARGHIGTAQAALFTRGGEALAERRRRLVLKLDRRRRSRICWFVFAHFFCP